jgi:hypothetical protein
MQPYNECENRWLSKIKTKVKDHYKKNEPLYAALSAIMLVALLILALLTSLESFLEIDN